MPHYQSTFMLAGSGMARVALDGRFIDVNDHFCALLGYSREHLLGLSFQDLTFPEDLNVNAQMLKRVVDREADDYRFQKRYIRSNGEILWADLTVVAEKDNDDRVIGLISVVSDIGHIKSNEERMQFLLDELAHRSKNLFAVVQGVVNQTTADTVPDFRTLLNQRIHAMATSNDMLVGPDPVTLSVSEMLTRQLAAFVPADDVRITRTVADVPLGASAMRMLGMAIHELATNSCKYGALSELTGRVDITCRTDPDDGRVTICWLESGGPTVSPPTRTGFGRKVIEHMVARSLHADIQLDFHPEGVAWRCRAPAENFRR